MDLAELNRRLAVTEQIAREAGTLARTWFDQRDRLQIEAKGPQNLVSEADRAVEVLIRDRLGAAFPGERVIGEEGGDDGAQGVDPGGAPGGDQGHAEGANGGGPIWIVDPTPTATATLFACHPPGSVSHRIVVKLDLAT